MQTIFRSHRSPAHQLCTLRIRQAEPALWPDMRRIFKEFHIGRWWVSAKSWRQRCVSVLPYAHHRCIPPFCLQHVLRQPLAWFRNFHGFRWIQCMSSVPHSVRLLCRWNTYPWQVVCIYLLTYVCRVRNGSLLPLLGTLRRRLIWRYIYRFTLVATLNLVCDGELGQWYDRIIYLQGFAARASEPHFTFYKFAQSD